MKNIILVALLATLFGCAASAPYQKATHNWTAEKRILKFAFADNNKNCATSAQTVSAYEACMQEYGYRLVSQR